MKYKITQQVTIKLPYEPKFKGIIKGVNDLPSKQGDIYTVLADSGKYRFVLEKFVHRVNKKRKGR